MKPSYLITALACLLSQAYAQNSAPPPSLSPTALPGEPATKMRTLLQIESRTPVNADTCPPDNPNHAGNKAVFRITSPGSYYLTANLTGVSGQHGIVIGSPRVTLDLNGFELLGVTGSLDGIVHTGTGGVHVHNGTVRGFGGDGVEIGKTGELPNSISHLRSADNGDRGIAIVGTATHCTVHGNAGRGIDATGTVDSCIATNNADGIVVTDGIVTRSTASGNSAYGFSLFRADADTCKSYSNTIGGFFGKFSGAIRNCTATANTRATTTAAGIRLAGPVADFRIENNHISSNDIGIDAPGARAVVIGNTSVRNNDGTHDTDYIIGAGNFVGQILQMELSPGGIDTKNPNTVPNSGLGSGSTAVPHPWTNFYD